MFAVVFVTTLLSLWAARDMCRRDSATVCEVRFQYYSLQFSLQSAQISKIFRRESCLCFWRERVFRRSYFHPSCSLCVYVCELAGCARNFPWAAMFKLCFFFGRTPFIMRRTEIDPFEFVYIICSFLRSIVSNPLETSARIPLCCRWKILLIKYWTENVIFESFLWLFDRSQFSSELASRCVSRCVLSVSHSFHLIGYNWIFNSIQNTPFYWAMQEEGEAEKKNNWLERSEWKVEVRMFGAWNEKKNVRRLRMNIQFNFVSRICRVES